MPGDTTETSVRRIQPIAMEEPEGGRFGSITGPILRFFGKTPLFLPPKAYSPHGAPDIIATWKQVTRSRIFSQAEILQNAMGL